MRAGSPDVRAIAAWPQQLLHERSGHVTGFTMPRIEGRVTIATAMNPGSRKATFPQATWGWLIHVGRNLAVAMEAVHGTGVVVGDVNDSNVLVGGDAVVRLIDVDSFQVRDGARVFTCDVGMPIYQPPELYGRSYPGLERTPNHDRFGLAVLIFQLVFMGRHPWAGIWKGADYAFDTGEVIARLPFVFGRDAANAGHRPPANTVRLDWLPEATAQLFERAFAKGAQPRPSGAEWATALAAFEGDLATCNVSAMHRYARSRGSCPWCDLERAGLFLFITGGSVISGGVVYLDADAVQRRIDEIPPLADVPVPVDPRAMSVQGEPLEPRLRLHRRLWLAGTVIAIVAAVAATSRFGTHGQHDLCAVCSARSVRVGGSAAAAERQAGAARCDARRERRLRGGGAAVARRREHARARAPQARAAATSSRCTAGCRRSTPPNARGSRRRSRSISCARISTSS